jgi:SpoVK/Ycf46/Vps4 family AAA+-type ATPase
MDLDTLELITYITLGTLVYYFLIELAKPKEGAQKWVAMFFVFIIALLLIYLAYIYYKKDDKKDKTTSAKEEEIIEDDTKSESEEAPVEFIQGDYKSDKKEFVMSNGASVIKNGIEYEDFKLWYLSPDFLKKYTEAIGEALHIKKKRLLEVKKQYAADLKALKGAEKPKEGIDNIISKLNNNKNDDLKMLESGLCNVNDLLSEIRKKESDLSINTTRRGLISALTDKKNGIDTLIGRKSVKDQLAAKMFAFSQNPRIFLSSFQNMAIYGPSGVGKSKLARVIAGVYSKCGILLRDHVHIITKQSLTTAFVNESGRMTRKVLMMNLESVVFLDEAYDITPEPSMFGGNRDHGSESITEIVSFTDAYKGLSILIVAGYEDQMETRFMASNEGLPRRFPNKIILQPYNAKELTDILVKFLLDICPDLKFNEKHGNYIYTVINYLNKENHDVFKTQAGAMENLASSISTSIYSSPDKIWSRDYESIILNGFNSYLVQHNVSLDCLE